MSSCLVRKVSFMRACVLVFRVILRFRPDLVCVQVCACYACVRLRFPAALVCTHGTFFIFFGFPLFSCVQTVDFSLFTRGFPEKRAHTDRQTYRQTRNQWPPSSASTSVHTSGGFRRSTVVLFRSYIVELVECPPWVVSCHHVSYVKFRTLVSFVYSRTSRMSSLGCVIMSRT